MSLESLKQKINNPTPETASENLEEYARVNSLKSLKSKLGSLKEDPIVSPVTETVPTQGQEASFLQRNLDIPFGLTGAAGGATAGGMLFGPPGALVGGVVGGALGTGTGVAASEIMYKDTPELEAYSKAVEAALWSAGLDVATMGVASKLKPAWIAMRAKRGQTAEETALEIAEGIYPAGSPESLAVTQQILQRRGATLLPSQIMSRSIDNFREVVASVGLISREKMNENILAVNDAIQDELLDLINKNASSFDVDPSSMGMVFDGLIEEGRRAISDQYGKGLGEIEMALKQRSRLGNRVPVADILLPVKRYTDSKTYEVSSDISAKVKSFLDENLGGLYEKLSDPGVGDTTFGVHELIVLDRSFTRSLREQYGKGGSTPSAQIEQSINEAGDVLRNAIYKSLERQAPEQAAQYKALKDAYSEAVTEISPTINQAFINGAGNGSYQALGNIAAKTTNVDQLRALKTSLRRSHAEAMKTNPNNVAIQNFDEVSETMKRGFLSEKLKQVSDDKFNASSLRSVANSLKSPKEEAIYKEMLGTDYPRFKQLMNVVLETSESASGDFGTLALRAAETKGVKGAGAVVSDITRVGTTGGATAGAFVAGGPLAALGVGTAALYVPNVFAKIVTNPQYANKLIMLAKTGQKDPYKTELALTFLLSDVIEGMTEQERQELTNYIGESSSEYMSKP